MAFLADYGKAFGIQDPSQVRVLREVARDETGMEHVRFQQLHRDVPVTGGELTVHLRGADVVSVLAETLSDLDSIDVVPTLDAETALIVAEILLEKNFDITDATLSEPRLEIFNRGVLEDIEYPTRLAWFIEATRLDLREFIWIEAHTGIVILNFSQLTDALNRTVRDANSTASYSGTVCREEGDSASGDTDCDSAYDYSGDTYNYFLNEHGRDSYDGAGAALVSVVDYCPSSTSCPYGNAFWNGSLMNTRFLIDADGQKTAIELSIRDFRALLERLEELEDLQLIEERKSEPSIAISSLEDLFTRAEADD